MDFKEAVKRYRNASADDFEKPNKTHSTFERDGWFLRAADGRLLCIIRPDGCPVWGAALNAVFRQLQLGMPAPHSR